MVQIQRDRYKVKDLFLFQLMLVVYCCLCFRWGGRGLCILMGISRRTREDSETEDINCSGKSSKGVVAGDRRKSEHNEGSLGLDGKIWKTTEDFFYLHRTFI